MALMELFKSDRKILNSMGKAACFMLVVFILSLLAWADIYEKIDKLSRECRAGNTEACGEIAEIARNDKDGNVRLAAAARLKDKSLAQAIFANIAKYDKDSAVREAAVEKLTDKDLLANLAKYGKDSAVREAAAAKLIVQAPEQGAYKEVKFYVKVKPSGARGKYLGSATLENGKLNVNITDKRLEKIVWSKAMVRGGEVKEEIQPDGQTVVVGGIMTYAPGTPEHLEAIINSAQRLGYYAEIQEKEKRKKEAEVAKNSLKSEEQKRQKATESIKKDNLASDESNEKEKTTQTPIINNLLLCKIGETTIVDNNSLQFLSAARIDWTNTPKIEDIYTGRNIRFGISPSREGIGVSVKVKTVLQGNIQLSINKNIAIVDDAGNKHNINLLKTLDATLSHLILKLKIKTYSTTFEQSDMSKPSGIVTTFSDEKERVVFVTKINKDGRLYTVYDPENAKVSIEITEKITNEGPKFYLVSSLAETEFIHLIFDNIDNIPLDSFTMIEWQGLGKFVSSKPGPTGKDITKDILKARPPAINRSDSLFPSYTQELSGSNEVRVKNPNEFSVKVGLRSENQGKNFAVNANATSSVFVPDGSYEIYFVYSNESKALYKGDSFTLSKNGVEIQIVQRVDGNFGIKRVK